MSLLARRHFMPKPAPIFAPGDLLFFSGRGVISRVIKGFTCSPWQWFWPCWSCVSHVGVCIDYYGRTLLIESTTLCDEPCEITGRMHKGMQAHLPRLRVKGDDGFVFHCKPNIDRMSFTVGDNKALRRFMVRYLGADYDYIGAVESVVRPSNADLSRVFCSEVVAGAMMDIGRLPLGDPGEYTPSRLVKELVRIGTYRTPERVR